VLVAAGTVVGLGGAVAAGWGGRVGATGGAVGAGTVVAANPAVGSGMVVAAGGLVAARVAVGAGAAARVAAAVGVEAGPSSLQAAAAPIRSRGSASRRRRLSSRAYLLESSSAGDTLAGCGRIATRSERGVIFSPPSRFLI
jgi:hypothetical protein